MSCQNINGLEELEHDVWTNGKRQRLPPRNDEDRNISPCSENTKKKTKRLASFTSAERKIERRRLENQQWELDCAQELFEDILQLEKSLVRKSRITPALIEELKASAKRSASSIAQPRYKALSFELVDLYTRFEIRELKQMTLGLWNHRIMDGFRLWAKDRLDGKGKLRRINRTAEAKSMYVFLQAMREV